MSEPTLEQLENTCLALGLPLLPKSLRPPYYEQSLRNLHRLAQKALDGDEEAAKSLTYLKKMFGRPE